MRLSYRKPFDYAGLLAFLRPRAIPGVEVVDGDEYRRTIAIDGTRGVICVRDDGDALLLSVPRELAHAKNAIAERVSRVFDLFADPDAIRTHLSRDAAMRKPVRKWPGARVPGAWDVFELAVRAVVGQQVSVSAATTLMGRIASRFGTSIDSGDAALTHVFPDAATLRDAPIDGMPATRAATIRAIAAADLENIGDLTTIRGVGPWTASYIAMRRGDPDAFPAGDLVLRRAAGDLTERELLTRAEVWRPWRAYAAILLWRGSAKITRMSAHTVEQHFEGRAPIVRAIYDAVIRVSKKFGPIVEDPKKTSIHLNRRSAFAGVATRKDALVLTIKSPVEITSPRIQKREQLSAHRWYFYVRVEDPKEVDAELTAWLKQSFELSA